MKICCAFLILGIILYLNFTVTVKLRVDVVSLKVYGVLYFAFIPIVRVFVFFSRISVKFRIFIRFLSTTVFFNLTGDKNDDDSIARFADNKYRPTVDIKSIDFAITAGRRGDAMFSALLYKTVERIMFSIVGYVNNTQKVNVSYSGKIEDENKLELFTVVSVNLSFSIILVEIAKFVIGKLKADVKNNNIKKERNINDNGTKGQSVGTHDGKLLQGN